MTNDMLPEQASSSFSNTFSSLSSMTADSEGLKGSKSSSSLQKIPPVYIPRSQAQGDITPVGPIVEAWVLENNFHPDWHGVIRHVMDTKAVNLWRQEIRDHMFRDVSTRDKEAKDKFAQSLAKAMLQDYLPWSK